MLIKQNLNISNIKNWVTITFLITALVGFSDAVYLTVQHFLNKIPPCTIGGCETVLTSKYAQIFGIPVSLMGTLYYLAIIVLIIIFLDTKKEIFLRIPVLLSFLGLIASIYFSYLQLFVINAFCPYCAVSALTSLTIFILSVHILRK